MRRFTLWFVRLMDTDAQLVLPILFVAIFLFCLFQTGCGTPPQAPPEKAEADPNKNKQRFEVHYQSIGHGPGLYRIHDKQTGKDYLAVDHCSVTEIAPTNKELPYDK